LDREPQRVGALHDPVVSAVKLPDEGDALCNSEKPMPPLDPDAANLAPAEPALTP
jgi:hypothetical protein